MQSKLIALLAAILVALGGTVTGFLKGQEAERLVWEHRSEQIRADASEAARVFERRQQKGIQDALQAQLDDERRISAVLRDDLDGLRDRPPRIVRLPGEARDCAGATGRELSGPDAEFLAGLAARAEGIRAALKNCYAQH